MAARAKKAKKAAAKSARRSEPDGEGPKWTFLSNHTHVLISLHRDPDLTLREVANLVGITERSVQRILGELEEAGYVIRERKGLRNHYRFALSAPLRHPIEAHRRIADLVDMIEQDAP